MNSAVQRGGCSDASCRRCRVPLQSTEVQGAVCATMDLAEDIGCFWWMLSCRVPCVQRKIGDLAFTNHWSLTSKIAQHSSTFTSTFRNISLLTHFLRQRFLKNLFIIWFFNFNSPGIRYCFTREKVSLMEIVFLENNALREFSFARSAKGWFFNDNKIFTHSYFTNCIFYPTAVLSPEAVHFVYNSKPIIKKKSDELKLRKCENNFLAIVKKNGFATFTDRRDPLHDRIFGARNATYANSHGLLFYFRLAKKIFQKVPLRWNFEFEYDCVRLEKIISPLSGQNVILLTQKCLFPPFPG